MWLQHEVEAHLDPLHPPYNYRKSRAQFEHCWRKRESKSPMIPIWLKLSNSDISNDLSWHSNMQIKAPNYFDSFLPINKITSTNLEVDTDSGTRTSCQIISLTFEFPNLIKALTLPRKGYTSFWPAKRESDTVALKLGIWWSRCLCQKLLERLWKPLS